MFVLEIAVLHTASHIVDEPTVVALASYAQALTYAVGYADGRPIRFHDEAWSRNCGRDLVATVLEEN